jgi:23S rRNA G2445 N2-methylase RlmL
VSDDGAVLAARAQVALASRTIRGKKPDPSAIADARRNLEAAKLARHIRQVVASAPPLTPEQRSALAQMLLSGVSR